MITEADVARIDLGQVHKIYDKWPEHFRAAAGANAKIDRDASFYDSIFLCGMGASGTSCDILRAYPKIIDIAVAAA